MKPETNLTLKILAKTSKDNFITSTLKELNGLKIC